MDFQTFRNQLHHEIKREGALNTVVDILENRRIDKCLDGDYIVCAMYLLSLVDFVLKKNNLPVPMEYRSLRQQKLEKPFYVGDNLEWKTYDNCIPEFVMHNIYERDLFDAV